MHTHTHTYTLACFQSTIAFSLSLAPNYDGSILKAIYVSYLFSISNQNKEEEEKNREHHHAMELQPILLVCFFFLLCVINTISTYTTPRRNDEKTKFNNLFIYLHSMLSMNFLNSTHAESVYFVSRKKKRIRLEKMMEIGFGHSLFSKFVDISLIGL